MFNFKSSIATVTLTAAVMIMQSSYAQSPTALPRVAVLATGGTIAQTDSKEAKLLIDQLLLAVPQISKVASVTAEQVFQVSSPDITPENWLTLAKKINATLAQDDVQGVVVTHGTDTMEETAYFLNLVVKSRKPVVLVGSMRGSQSPSADGPANLLNAVTIAADNTSNGKGVLVTLNDRIYAARDVTKTNTSTLDAFQSPDSGSLGYLQSGKPNYYRLPTRKHMVDSEFDVERLTALPKVQIVYSYVGIEPETIRSALSGKVSGIVFGGTGNGSVPKALQGVAMEASKSGVPFVRSSRVNGGIVEHNGEHNDDTMQLISSDSLNPQKARVLLMLALTKTSDVKQIQEMFYRY